MCIYKFVKKHTRNIIAMLMIVLLSASSFAVVVSDNDGAAFIAKAEFDSLRNNFQSQLDQYNTSIDIKIDNAIAAYLEGVTTSTKATLKNLINKSANSFMSNKRYDGSKLGTKYTANYVFSYGNISSYNGSQYTCCVTEATATTWFQPIAIVYNASDQEKLYYAKKITVDNRSYYTILGLYSTEYTAVLFGGNHGYNKGTITGSNAYITIPTKVVTKGNKEYFGLYNDTFAMEAHNCTYDDVCTYSYGWFAVDTSIANSEINYLAGGSMPESSINVLDINEVSKLGDAIETRASSNGLTRSYLGSSRSVDYSNSNYTTSFSNTIYRHKYVADMTAAKVVNETLTNIVGKPVYYYNGIPMFKATEDNCKVKFDLVFSNTSGANTKWAINSDAFSNAANPGDCGDIQNCTETTFYAANGEKITVEFDVKKDKTYWIKLDPTSGYSSVEIDGDILQTNK